MTDWRSSAACKDLDSSLWFPGKGEVSKTAVDICRGCLMQTECLDYAMTTYQPEGVWGGLSARQRKSLRRRRAA